jgi:predicted membrane protein
MVVCVVSVIAIGGILVGLMAFYSPLPGGWNWNDATTDFSFDDTLGSTTGTVELDLDLSVGGVKIAFENDSNLLYRIDMTVPNNTVIEHGDPVVTFSSNTITLNYPVGGVNVTLGSGVNYTLDVKTSTGAIDLALTAGAHIGDVALNTSVGAISLLITDDAVINGAVEFSLYTSVGSINVVVDLPTDVGGSFDATASVGSIEVVPSGWTETTSDHYETDDYDTASNTVTITAITSTGSINATLT